MPSSLLTFKTRLYGPLGRNDSAVADFITRGVNFACLLVAMLYSPPELQTSGTVTVLASASSVSLSTLTRLENVKTIWNTSGSKKVWPVQLEILDLISPLATAAAAYNRLYSRDGSTLHVRPVCTAANALLVYYSQFPAVVSDDGDEISFSNFDPIVESYALAFAWACLEETESAGIWQKIGDTLAVPQQLLLKTRQYLEGGPIHGNDSKGA